MKKIITALLVILVIIIGAVLLTSNSSKVEKDGPGIIMNSPSSGSTVGKTFIVSGEANVFEANVSIAVENSEGDTVYEGSTTADMPDVGEWGPFEAQVTLPDTVNDGDNL